MPCWTCSAGESNATLAGQYIQQNQKTPVRHIKLFEYFSKRYFDHIHDLDELKKEWRRLNMLHHPDRGGSDEMMQEINNQYQAAVARVVSMGSSRPGNQTNASNNQSDRTQSDRTQSDRTQSDRTQSQSDRTQSDRTSTNTGHQRQSANQQTRKSGPRKKRTAEDRQRSATQARAKYDEMVAKAKADLDRSNRKTFDEFQAKNRQFPQKHDTHKFIYEEELLANKQRYNRQVASANKFLQQNQ